MGKQQKHPEYQYLDLLQEILDTGIKKVDRGTNVVLYSLFGKQTRYDLSKGFPLLTTKKVYWKGVLHELYWFISGQTNIKYLVDNNVHIWDDYPYKRYKIQVTSNKSKILTKEEFIEKIARDKKFAKKWGELPKIYGEMWRNWPTRTRGRTIDQLKWVLQELKDDPDAKNLIINSWNPEYLYTMAEKKDASLFPICHNMYQISNRNGKLSLQLYQRSADIFLGVPFNIASYALLTIILAKIAGLEPGEFIHTFGDVHIYENHIEQVKEQLKRKPKSFPTIKLDPKLKLLDSFKPEMVTLENYDPHPGLAGELTVAGGLFDPKTGRMAGIV
ncbi:thymidylate synthase [Candidatus Daviesbacteria bacterium RIFCSPHIGHO2_12_FULL_37_11]|uniref:Thymidylate synthase n=1 Tax=Candidatus Daviesbacteria bacterium RIFCSPHIGHO2_12_FULL_37_11 TaxID=1797777 RepID=A0A1F5KA21_9BACT|nr:MAG: Thymidylate synthase [Candidatus Daviesbacteria bacterium GW2011_GWA1_38_7]OGE16135.1 MAG: thymidylate synthase [Candidatus Daviesbacteria bacterium RIFCSPHIGHO2_01_FULL_37_27]OGE37658.1 MAG: thymidylate synthase [Candidatus Daviesbacteria bacterium RIFCSPHIGHO2_12_FULL_37_11]OGE45415.1 MAG: thymidylate synthase [Candidatus Daviesbacteria bacterium RIFCSPLOWO2_01_FULL_37_10]